MNTTKPTVVKRGQRVQDDQMKEIEDCDHPMVYKDLHRGYCCCTCPAWRDDLDQF